jgi:hypothetical protein
MIGPYQRRCHAALKGSSFEATVPSIFGNDKLEVDLLNWS